MPNYIWSFERYKQAFRLNQLIENLMNPSAAEPEIEIESPHNYNLIDNIIVIGDKQ